MLTIFKYIFLILKRLVQDLNLRGQSPTDFKSVPLTALATRQKGGK